MIETIREVLTRIGAELTTLDKILKRAEQLPDVPAAEALVALLKVEASVGKIATRIKAAAKDDGGPGLFDQNKGV